MKKVLKMLIPVLVLAMALAIGANAFSGINSDEQRVLDFIKNIKEIQIGRSTYAMKDEYNTHAFNVLNRESVDLTKAQADKLIAIMQELLDMCKKYDTESAQSLTDAQKRDIEKKLQEAAALVNLTANFDTALSKMTIKDSNPSASSTVVEIAIGETPTKTDPVIKQTGADSFALIGVVAAGLAVIACAYVLNSKRVHD